MGTPGKRVCALAYHGFESRPLRHDFVPHGETVIITVLVQRFLSDELVPGVFPEMG